MRAVIYVSGRAVSVSGAHPRQLTRLATEVARPSTERKVPREKE